MTSTQIDFDLITAPDKAQLNEYGQLYGCARAFSIANLALKKSNPVVVITEDVNQSQILQHELSFFVSSKCKILELPDWETLPYDIFSPHQDIISQRLTTLYQLSDMQSGDILILPVSTLLQRLPPKSYIKSQVLMLKQNQALDLDDFRISLEQNGYQCVSQVMEHGEFAVRGSIIDLYPSGHDLPFRIDLFDTDIDSIRQFDPESQRSLDAIKSIEILPAREFPFNKEAISEFRTRYREQLSGDPTTSKIYQEISQGIIPNGIEYYLPLFFDELNTIFNYIPKNTIICSTKELIQTIEHFNHDVAERYEQRCHDIERPILKPESLYLNTEELLHSVQDFSQIQTQTEKNAPGNSANDLPFKAPAQFLAETRTDTSLVKLVSYVKEYTGRILLITESAGRREMLLEMLHDQKLFPNVSESWHEFVNSTEHLSIAVASIDRGLSLNEPEICILTEAQIFGERSQQQRRKRKRTRDAEAIIGNLTDLSMGSPVVHEEHGVGRYLGLQKLTMGDIETEVLTIEYAGGDKLYVPVASLDLISRYTGADADHAPQHRLGTETWSKARKKAAKKINDIAVEILDIHARRAAKGGLAYNINMDEYNQFSAAFPFEETEDQLKAINSVMEDLSEAKSMDRVVCGDVGFGKTEVAMRATFIAANANKQVAILVPTTLLAQQHFQNFKDRFADWPFKIECLSRFNTKKQQDQVIADLKNGKVDIIIGTHKLLQKDIGFDNLGLLIIDEEHRFGVKHKEQFKNLRAEVDILTLTATPIPRTLNMSLAGLRDLSIIASPPTQRHAIKTFVSEWNDQQVHEACLREIKRGGQVYVLHNEVKTIEKMCKTLEDLIPEASVQFAHGQMREKDLERIMLDFVHQRFNILVSTTIIESGIDIPSANTIIINRADKLGLAQLHQIRGRVGRSHHRAFAYLITPPKKAMTKDAVKRLEAIESLEDLGVGFTLATHDLEIRGAGELLGDDQSGQIHEIGFSLYTELLDRAVKALKSGKTVDLDKPIHQGTTIDLGVPALLPDDYIYDIHTRLILYKRISNAPNQHALDEVRVELIDRFGLLPDIAKNLFEVTSLKLLTQCIGVEKITAVDSLVRIIFNLNANIDPARLISLIQSEPQIYKLNGTNTLIIYKETTECEQRVKILHDILNSLMLQEAA
ncbi:MAG: transcription-repair coupling factor [endosymbiont of Galathealinum brachiosum]|uniref:Transcription-repair-coupling factor n=1 Tax=endosymbiont of Galathealinum brachiosum TaxID=2200906 RepID=A0A370DHI3_9GAMM|nr:MAG: transcription-repair coupling factor [endosymbiont of Galathealinum brachiosum]